MRNISTLLTALIASFVTSLAWGTDEFTTPAPNGNPAKYAARNAHALGAARAINPDVIFIGDSITAHFSTGPAPGLPVWEAKLKPLKAANLGFSGDKTQNVLWRLDNGDWSDIHPKVVVLLIGVNNRDTGELLVQAQRTIIMKLREKFRQARIIFIPVLPKGIVESGKKATIVTANAAAPGLAKEFPEVTVLDMSANFLNADGTQIKSLYADSVHLSREGYEVWAAEIVPVITKLLDR